MKPIIAPFIALCFSAAALHAAPPPVEEVIRQARAWLGSEEALAAVNSLHFVGTIQSSAKDARPGAADIVYAKPMQQRISITFEEYRQVNGLDGYDGWVLRQELTGRKRSKVTSIGALDVRMQQAQTRDNLFFFAATADRGARAESAGTATIDGIECNKVNFVHPGMQDSEIVFTRYFDQATGRCVLTEIDGEVRIREEGEILAGGIRFPRRLVTEHADGTVVTFSFDSVTVNEPVTPDMFSFPSGAR